MALWRLAIGGEHRLARGPAGEGPRELLPASLTVDGLIVGYLNGNDMSSRSIEGENPLYLPQAKIYTGSCAVGPCLATPDEVGAPAEGG